MKVLVRKPHRICNGISNFIRELAFDRYGVTGLLMLATISILAALAPCLPIPYFNSMDFPRMLPPSPQHPFGTDHLGRDMLSRVLWGARTSLMVGIAAAGISSLIGIILGSLAGYFGGRIDEVVSGVTNIFLVIPTFFLALILLALFGSSIYLVMIAIGVTTWPTTARVMRAQVLSAKERLFVEAARAVGATDLYILFRLVVPSALPPALAYTILQVGSAIMIEAGLSYLGLGDPNFPSWGRMIYEGQIYITTAPWIALIPGAFLVYTVLGINFLGYSLLKLLTPKLREL